MQSNESTSNQKPITLKCKPFSILSDVPSKSSPPKRRSTARRSTRIASRTNENEMAGSGRNKKTKPNGVERKKKSANQSCSQNRIESSDDDDEDFVNSRKPKTNTPKGKKRRNRNNVQSDNDDDDVPVPPKRKTPVKRRGPLLTIKCNKITDYFGKSTTTTTRNEAPIPDPVTPPSDVIVLSSSDEFDDAIEQNVTLIDPSPQLPPSSPLTVIPFDRQQSRSFNCPHYKIVEGTNFAVDAFRYGNLDGVSAYFLTHFHSDHYTGLDKKFDKTIYMSTVTGRLVRGILKVNEKFVRTMTINTTYVIDGVEVTPIDANHCPGAVMFIFKLPCGRTILHTGDFRATPEMESNPVFWNNNISTIYLDTTYLHRAYDFGTQSDALQFVEDEVEKFKQKIVDRKFVIVVGSYLIGKERVWSHIAQTFNMKVWIEPDRRRAFDLIYSDENDNHIIKDCICDVREEAQLHVIPIHCVNFPFLVDYLKNFQNHNLLAFRPTGWAKDLKPQYGSNVSIVAVQYSEHSSYRELERFVRFIQPETVYSTVPISSKSPKTASVPVNWLTTQKPMTTSQRTMTEFLKVRKNSSIDGIKNVNEGILTPSSTSQMRLGCGDEGSNDSAETDFML